MSRGGGSARDAAGSASAGAFPLTGVPGSDSEASWHGDGVDSEVPAGGVGGAPATGSLSVAEVGVRSLLSQANGDVQVLRRPTELGKVRNGRNLKAILRDAQRQARVRAAEKRDAAMKKGGGHAVASPTGRSSRPALVDVSTYLASSAGRQAPSVDAIDINTREVAFTTLASSSYSKARARIQLEAAKKGTTLSFTGRSAQIASAAARRPHSGRSSRSAATTPQAIGTPKRQGSARADILILEHESPATGARSDSAREGFFSPVQTDRVGWATSRRTGQHGPSLHFAEAADRPVTAPAATGDRRGRGGGVLAGNAGGRRASQLLHKTSTFRIAGKGTVTVNMDNAQPIPAAELALLSPSGYGRSRVLGKSEEGGVEQNWMTLSQAWKNPQDANKGVRIKQDEIQRQKNRKLRAAEVTTRTNLKSRQRVSMYLPRAVLEGRDSAAIPANSKRSGDAHKRPATVVDPGIKRKALLSWRTGTFAPV